MSADLEDVIAAALAGHWRAHVDIAGDDIRFVCECGTVEIVKGSGHSSTTTWSRAHQARAVLAALESAGQVEWGWEYRGLIGGKYDRRITRNWTADRALTQEEAQSEVDNMNYRHPNIARLIHRTATAWMAVEG